MRIILTLFSYFCVLHAIQAQQGYGNQWIFGRFNSPNPSGTILNFNGDSLLIEPIDKPMELEGSCAIMCDSVGKLLFYSNSCYIANANHQVMVNGEGIGQALLETSFCNSGGNPLTQGMIALPKPGSQHLYYLFYTDIDDPYYMQPFFPLAPVTLYYALIDMSLENGLGAVIEKNVIVLEDTLSRGMIQAARHFNGEDWWIIQPKSHSNCYWTLRLTKNGVDTTFKQCVGQIWGDNDPTGQATFSPNNIKYARANYPHNLNIFDFNSSNGTIVNPLIIELGQDTFYSNGVAFSSNSRVLYAPCYNKLWQFDTWASDISSSRVLIAELNTPSDIPEKTRFNQARLAPDGKIYIAGTGPHKHLHVINRPNCLGIACDLQQYAIPLAARNSYTMPNMPHYKSWNQADSCESVATIEPSIREERAIQLHPNPAHESLTVNVPKSSQGNLQVFSAFGNLLLEQAIVSEQTSIEVSAFPQGIYYLHVLFTDGQRKCLKFVVSK
jgi:hypothetical protein